MRVRNKKRCFLKDFIIVSAQNTVQKVDHKHQNSKDPVAFTGVPAQVYPAKTWDYKHPCDKLKDQQMRVQGVRFVGHQQFFF